MKKNVPRSLVAAAVLGGAAATPVSAGIVSSTSAPVKLQSGIGVKGARGKVSPFHSRVFDSKSCALRNFKSTKVSGTVILLLGN